MFEVKYVCVWQKAYQSLHLMVVKRNMSTGYKIIISNKWTPGQIKNEEPHPDHWD